MNDGDAASFALGTFYFTNSNNFTGGITNFTGNETDIGIGNDAALGTGLTAEGPPGRADNADHIGRGGTGWPAAARRHTDRDDLV